MLIKILGSGCANCQKLETHVKKAVEEIGLQASVEKVTQMEDILAYGVMKTPALVIDEVVKFSGRVPSVGEIKKYLK